MRERWLFHGGEDGGSGRSGGEDDGVRRRWKQCQLNLLIFLENSFRREGFRKRRQCHGPHCKNLGLEM